MLLNPLNLHWVLPHLLLNYLYHYLVLHFLQFHLLAPAPSSQDLAATTPTSSSETTVAPSSANPFAETSSAVSTEPAVESSSASAAPVAESSTITSAPVAESTPVSSEAAPATSESALPTSVTAVTASTIAPAQTDDWAESSGSVSTTTIVNWLPSTMVADHATATSSSASSTESSTSTSPLTIQSSLPKVITPANSVSSDSSYDFLITIGFNGSLSYDFVAKSPVTSAQIFEYLPGVLSFAMSDELDSSKIAIKQLLPYITPEVDYLVTVAEVYIKKSALNKLSQLIQDNASQFYNNTDDAENSLANLVDSRVPLTGLLTGTDSSSGSDAQGNTPGGLQGLGSMDTASYSVQVNANGTQGNHLAGVIAGSSVGVVGYCLVITALYKYRQNHIKKQQGQIELLSSASSSIDNNGYESEGVDSFEYFLNGNSNSQITSNGNNSPVESSIPNNNNNSASRTNSMPASMGSWTKFLNRASTTPESEHSKYIPTISAPMNAKNSLGW
ncbi:unnamed protein product [Ambrosiozyma monospora]|uniref:Unnamed protein product n=1 Tax=Ambrosiozyma monospora TaxID=43982 RepID=A0ACB5T0H5_AMBMO|nr:unnamed protein product [Ambrosiozyma monospora]